MAFTVCIDALDEGGYRVYVESPAAEAQEGAAMPGQAPAEMSEGPEEGPQEPEAGAQTVKTIKEALTACLEALKNEGQMSDAGAQAQDFNEGFGSPQAQKPGAMA